MAYKQQPKSPVLKALKGNQGKLPQQLQDAIKAAPESPAKQTKRVNPSSLDKKTVNSARQMLKKSGVNNPNLTDAEVVKAAKGKGVYAEARSQAKQGLRKSATSFEYGSPAKQTTAGEFAHKKSIKDKEMGKSTKVVDKFASALEAPFSDKTYSELKKEKRAKQKAKYDAKSPAKQTKAAKRQMGPLDKTNPHKPGSAESKKYRKDYNTQFYDARAGKLKAGMKPLGVSKTKSPAKKYKK